MKKLVISMLLTLSVMPMALAIDINEEYGFGYDVEKSDKSRGGENSLFSYKDETIVFLRNDTAYVTRFDKEKEELKRPVIIFDFQNINLTGRAAYDKLNNKLYYTAYDKKLKGDFLYVSEMGEDGKWMAGTKVKIKGTTTKSYSRGYVRNSGYTYTTDYLKDFYNPEISEDGKRLYFTASFDNKSRDIYYSDLIDEEQQIWSYPTAFGVLNSSAADEDYFLVDEDDSLVYVARKVGKTFQQMYAEALNDSAYNNPEAMADVFNEASSYNLALSGEVPVFISDKEGKPNLYIFKMNYEGRKKSFYWVFFRFAFNEAKLDGIYYGDVDALALELQKFPGEKFEIAGYSDVRGSAEYNKELSQKRADCIKAMLVERGFSPDDLVAVGKGKEESGLKVKNAKNEGEHAQNRRVEVRVIMNR